MSPVPSNAPATTTPAPAEKPVEVKAVVFGTDNQSHEFFVGSKKPRGQDTELPTLIAKLDLTTEAPMLRFFRAIGLPVALACVYREVIRPACLEASAEAFDEKTNKFDMAKFVKALVDWFQAPSRKQGGPNLKELLIQANQLSMELAQLVTLEAPTDAQRNRVLQLAVKLGELNQLIMKKQRKGKNPTETPAVLAKA